tara:strand:- start:1349 stop:1534 length:186 start_codon:yes stop_codon:yes gene_type:complete
MRFILTVLFLLALCGFYYKSTKEGLCGDYSFTYGSIKKLWDNEKIVGTFNEYFKRDLSDFC